MKTVFKLLAWIFGVITFALVIISLYQPDIIIITVFPAALTILCIIFALITHTPTDIDSLADGFAEAVDMDNLKEEVINEIVNEKAQPFLITLQDKILSQTAVMKACNRGAFNAFIRGLNEAKDIPMLNLILHHIKEENITITGKLEDMFIETTRLTYDETELVYKYIHDRKKEA